MSNRTTSKIFRLQRLGVALQVCLASLGLLSRLWASPLGHAPGGPAGVRPAFAAGEFLRYELRYAFATGALIEFRTRDTILGGVPALHHRIDGKTRGVINSLYPVHDVYWSITERVSDLPLRAVRQVQEQKYRDYKEDTFFRHLRPDSLVLVRENGDTLVLPKGTHDVVSLFYYLRNRLGGMRLQLGMKIELPLFFNAEFYPLVIRYEGVQDVKTRFGRVSCYRFKPLVRQGDLFEDQEALTVWISRDANHVPVRVRFELFLGAMYCDLIGYSGLSHPLYVER